MLDRRLKVLLGKVSLDGHDRGIKIVAAGLRDAGMEVIYIGCFQTVDSMIISAIQEDVDVIGFSFQAGEHLYYIPQVVDKMKQNNLNDVLLLVGGVFPKEDATALKEMGVDEVFRSGTSIKSIVDVINERVPKGS